MCLLQVAKLVEGKSNSLESLTTCIALHLFGSDDSDHRSTARNLILDVASRKFYGAKAGFVIVKGIGSMMCCGLLMAFIPSINALKEHFSTQALRLCPIDFIHIWKLKLSCILSRPL